MKRFLNGSSNNLVVIGLSVALGASLAGLWTGGNRLQAQEAQRKVLAPEQKAVLTSLQDSFANIAESAEPFVVTVTARAVAQSAQARPPERMQGPAPGRRPSREDLRRFFGDPSGPGGPNVPKDFPFDLREFFENPQGIPMPDQDRGPSMGSGVLIRQNGGWAYVLTNNHVVKGRDKFRVELNDQSEYPAELVGMDEKADLAVLKFHPQRTLPAAHIATLGDSDKVRVGEFVMAIGSPLGYEQTLTVGVVSAKGRELRAPGTPIGSYNDLIQTDASINHGNSGGPLINVDGEVIGINVAIAPGSNGGNIGIGFAIPSKIAKMVSNQLIEKGKVVRGYLGVGTYPTHRDLSPQLKEHLKVNSGALVETVSPGTPAHKAGVKPGDVVVRFNNRQVRSFTELEHAVAEVTPGDTVPAEVIRDGKPTSLQITVMERPSDNELRKSSGQAGPEGGRLERGGPERGARDEGVPSKFGLRVAQAEDGVRIVGMAPGSELESELFLGDVVTHVGKARVKTVEQFQAEVNRVDAKDGVIMCVKTENGIRYCIVRP